jgi:cell division septum initiation protein DivIVA
MAGSEKHGDDLGRAVEADIARYSDRASVELSAAGAREGPEQPGSRRLAAYRSGQADRSRLIKEAREPEFPTALRGYERTAVDRYVTQVTRLLAELELTSSPESAVRRALDEVSEETRGLLERAHQTAEEITARSRGKADDRIKQAEAEAQALRQAAHEDAVGIREAAQREADAIREAAQREARELRSSAQHEGDRVLADARRDADELLDTSESRARELAQNAETIWRERRRLVDDVRAIGEQLSSIGEAEAKRFPRLSEAIPPMAVTSRTKIASKANGGSEPERANGGSEPGGPASKSEHATPESAKATTGAE